MSTGSSNNLFGNLASSAGAAPVPAVASTETDAALAAAAAANQDAASGNDGNTDADVADAADAPIVNELDLLKARARTMGIAFSNNIKVETLRAKIAAKLNDEPDTVSDDDDAHAEIGSAPGPDFVPSPDALSFAQIAPSVPGSGVSLLAQIAIMSAEEKAAMLHLLGGSVSPPVTSAPKPAVSKIERDIALRKEIWDREMALIRVRIQNLDPKKANLPGEILTVANEWLGTVSKFIPYGEATDDGYHIPRCLLTQLQERTFLQIKTVKNKNGRGTTTTTADVREFAIEILEPLSVDELGKLAAAQAAAAGN